MKVTIYIPLDEEGTDVSRPALAEELSDGTFKILPQEYNADDEHWRFVPETVVRVEERESFGRKYLIAVESVG